ncbi:glucokinase [Phormidium sp. CLA17]|uniref:glucokinase n=1 Tax=Leptolyngbya sp. Cla-17 TaxID=2803751 RepID=UPI0014919D46|nr:glucokinase [Leptolyngbya sp. Cla-17]MBM0742783.1 glucokinase [Leptolyngbya sp. Cla-17]
MTILLAGDVGGTKTILRLVQAEQTDSARLPSLKTLYEHTYSSRDFPDLVPMVRLFMDQAKDVIGEVPLPESACFGIAGPVVHNASKLTNLGWVLQVEDLQRSLQIPLVTLINDFAAVGYGVLALPPEDICTLRSGQPDPTGAIAIIGAGTGLGQGYVIPQRVGYRVFATEGGHTDFSPRSELEYQLLRFLKERYDLRRVSVERVVSGMGIESIYLFMRSRGGAKESPEMAEIFQTWQQETGKEEKTVDLPSAISRHAQNNRDYLCQETMNLFVRAYGAEAGNLALKLLPYGGVYIAGGIAAKNLPLIQQGDFLEAFDDKGRVSKAIAQIPVHVVLNPRVGLLGSALCAAQLQN